MACTSCWYESKNQIKSPLPQIRKRIFFFFPCATKNVIKWLCTECPDRRGRMRIPIWASLKWGKGCNSSLIVGSKCRRISSSAPAPPRQMDRQRSWEIPASPNILSWTLSNPSICRYLSTMIGFRWRHLLREDLLHSRSEDTFAISTMELLYFPRSKL